MHPQQVNLLLGTLDPLTGVNAFIQQVYQCHGDYSQSRKQRSTDKYMRFVAMVCHTVPSV